MTPNTDVIPPLHFSILVGQPPASAFQLFTEGMGQWWPLASHSVGMDAAVRCIFEGRLEGEIYEEDADGRKHPWGTVQVWDPPRRVVFTWHPGHDEDTAQEVEVRFISSGDGTRVELEHRGWERLGSEAADTRERYAGGWAIVFGERYRGVASPRS